MERAWTWRVEKHEWGTRIVLAGTLDENARLEELESVLVGRVRVDLEGVKRMNSIGIHRWIRLIDRTNEALEEIIFERCSPAFVQQLNAISPVRGNAQVHSVMLPYFCSSCNQERSELLVLTEAPEIQGEKACPTCGEPMAFDDLKEAYLAFYTP